MNDRSEGNSRETASWPGTDVAKRLFNGRSPRKAAHRPQKPASPGEWPLTGAWSNSASALEKNRHWPVMAGPVQREAYARRRKPAVQAGLDPSRLLKSKCNHDRQLMADSTP